MAAERDRTEPNAALARLLSPRSIALVGASERSLWSKTTYDNLRRFGYSGRIVPVNPKGGTIHGLTAAQSCREIGEAVDAALLMVPEAALVDALNDLASIGAGGAVILSAGFAETGANGIARQTELTQAARAAGMRLIGPNCLGFVNYLEAAPIWTTPVRRPLANPTLAVVSQSGAVAQQLQHFAYQQRLGLTHMISTGNEADVDVADVIQYLVHNSPARAIAVFLESIRHPERFAQAALDADAAGKPLVVMKVGTSEAAAKAAQTHTGALVGDDRVFNAVCRRLGIIRAHSMEQLIITAELVGQLGRIEPQGLALMAGSGGICEIVIDQAEIEDIHVPELAPSTLAAIAETLPEYATAANPLDVTGAVMHEPKIIANSFRAMSSDENVGLAGYIFDSPPKDDERGSARMLMESIGAGMRESSKPTIMISNTLIAVSAAARQMSEDCGIFYTGAGVQHAMTGIGALFRWSGQKVDRSWARASSDAPARRPIGERGTLDHLAAHGVPVIPGDVARSADEAAASAARFGGPVVLKIASPDIAHKTEVGGVTLNLTGADAVGEAYTAMIERVGRLAPDARIDGVIVSPMRKGVELLVGTMRDAQWGPTIAVGLGGIFVEIFDDVSLRLLPIDKDDALEMLAELRGSQLLDGARGTEPVDRDVVAEAIAAIGNAALALGDDLVSLEVNPLLASGGAVEALDALTAWTEDQ